MRYFGILPIAAIVASVFVAAFLESRKQRKPPPQSWDRLEHPD